MMRSLRTRITVTMLGVIFVANVESINAIADEPWEQVMLSKGFAVYDPTKDSSVTQVMQRADKLMYDNKRDRKVSRGNT